MLPFMSKKEIKKIEDELKSLSIGGGKLKILEWGSGGSTVYFSKFLKNIGIPYKWISIEYNKNWYEKVKNQIEGDPGTDIKLFDVGNNHLRQKNNEMNEYVNYPNTLGEEFDFIFVDGRKRRRCLIEAEKFLKPKGVVFLHDAQRKYYHCAFNIFDGGRFMSMFLWRGDKNIITSQEKMINNLRFIYFRVLYLLFVVPFRWFKKKAVKIRKKVRGY